MNADRDGIKGQRMRIDDNERVSENDVMNDEWLCLPDRRSKDEMMLRYWLARSSREDGLGLDDDGLCVVKTVR